MGIARIKTWVAEVLTPGDLNAEFDNLANNAAQDGANSDITSLSGLTTPLSVAQGGTGAATAAAAISSLGGIAATIVDAKGDIIAATAADTVARVAVGANDTLLVADSTQAAGLKWASKAAMTIASSGANSDITSLTGLTTALTVGQGGTGSKYGPVLRGHIGGLKISNNGSDPNNDIDIAVGEATDSTGVVMITLGSAITKQLDAAWAVGTNQGGIDTGSKATSTWYYVWLIMRSDTGVVDALFSTSASAPTMPTNYDYKRRIGAIKTSAGGNILAFTQVEDTFYWAASVTDVSTTNPGTSAQTPTLSVPTGINTWAIINAMFGNHSASAVVFYASSPSQSDEGPSATTAPLGQGRAAISGVSGWGGQIYTSNSGAIRWRISASDGSTTVYIATLGWIDKRGRYT